MPTVLYVEDDPENREMMRMVFHDQDILLQEAGDGFAALDLIKATPPDLILLDLFMPRLDGFGLLRMLKKDEDTSQIPVIILSAWPTGDNRKRAEQAGAVDFVAKPYDPAQLMKLIKLHLMTSQIA